MKTIQFFIIAIFAIVSLGSQAQVVRIYKDGKLVDEFPSERVDSVVYEKPAPVPYKYYVGTTSPDTFTTNKTSNYKIFKVDFGQESERKYFVFPKEWGEPIFYDPYGGGEIGMDNRTERYNIKDYSVYTSSNICGVLHIKWLLK